MILPLKPPFIGDFPLPRLITRGCMFFSSARVFFLLGGKKRHRKSNQTDSNMLPGAGPKTGSPPCLRSRRRWRMPPRRLRRRRPRRDSSGPRRWRRLPGAPGAKGFESWNDAYLYVYIYIYTVKMKVRMPPRIPNIPPPQLECGTRTAKNHSVRMPPHPGFKFFVVFGKLFAQIPHLECLHTMNIIRC